MGRRRLNSSQGVVFTPPDVVTYMVEKLFALRYPRPSDTVLDPCCGEGAFVKGIIQWCEKRGLPLPQIVCVELNPRFAARCKRKFESYKSVKVMTQDFLLTKDLGLFDFIIGNPPYVAFEQIEEEKRGYYRRLFGSAVGRFDMYFLFFEKALKHLAPKGRLVFITPEKYLYVHSAHILRRFMAGYRIEEIELLDESTFKGLLTYPTITVISRDHPTETKVVLRDGSKINVRLPSNGSSWLPFILSKEETSRGVAYTLLKDICYRVSCGIATGKDTVFVIPASEVPKELRPYVRPAITGRELTKFKPGTIIDPRNLKHVILFPYSEDGRLLTEKEAPELIRFLSRYERLLSDRYCVRKNGKSWYAFHETPPVDIFKPKILCKDIAKEPHFWGDKTGAIVPLHNVYYIVPRDPAILPKLLAYLNSDKVKNWLKIHCQRAANNFLRMQAAILKRIPMHDEFEEAKCLFPLRSF